MTTEPMHLDGESIAQAIDAAVAAVLAGNIVANTAAHVANSAADMVTTGVITPANAAYTQADQTALANAVLSANTQIDALVSKINAILAALQTAGIMAAS